MVNWVEAQKPLLHGLMKMSGLRQQTVDIEPAGTTMTFWVPKEKKKKNQTHHEVVPVSRNNDNDDDTSKKKKKKKKGHEKPAVVLVHGFAAEGIVTWQFQVGKLTSKYSVYVPDLLFFGGSTTRSGDRSPAFQAECLMRALDELGVHKYTVVGFSYGGMIAFKMAESRPDSVHSLVVSGSVIAMTDAVSAATMGRLGFDTTSDLLLPESVKGLKALLSVATYRKLWFPDFLHRDFLKVMFNNRKERAELLDGLVISNKDAKVPNLNQRVLLLWGENDNIFKFELAKKMSEQLGEKCVVVGIRKAGHLAQLERPCVYTRRLKEFLASVHSAEPPALQDQED
ncbi:epoxide hydrolase 4-like [Iris pallida]|uniref:Epoxide hydrolase 4-like n=1 Tax=Iris pallida TaxID=29817 RepID=A0AAX6GJI5_IRIPA|nr:epoxide hydrolase 4-like [Iris pallida]